MKNVVNRIYKNMLLSIGKKEEFRLCSDLKKHQCETKVGEKRTKTNKIREHNEKASEKF